MGDGIGATGIGATIVYVGVARLPQPLATPAPGVAVELEVEPCSRKIIAVSDNLEFPGLARLLKELLVGRSVERIEGGVLLELEVRYSSPFTTALRVALQCALRRATEGVSQPEQSVPKNIVPSSA